MNNYFNEMEKFWVFIVSKNENSTFDIQTLKSLAFTKSPNDMKNMLLTSKLFITQFYFFFNNSGSNARKLLKFSSRLGYDDITWELGNEPNSLKVA